MKKLLEQSIKSTIIFSILTLFLLLTVFGSNIEIGYKVILILFYLFYLAIKLGGKIRNLSVYLIALIFTILINSFSGLALLENHGIDLTGTLLPGSLFIFSSTSLIFSKFNAERFKILKSFMFSLLYTILIYTITLRLQENNFISTLIVTLTIPTIVYFAELYIKEKREN